MKRFYRNGRRTGGSGDGNSDEVWKPFSDLWSIIVFTLILILMLFLLYARFEDIDEEHPNYIGEARVEEDGMHGFDNEADHGHADDYDDNNYTGRTGGHDYDYPVPVISGGGGEEGDSEGTGGWEEQGVKSAVYVAVIDGETERVIKEAGVTFELYSEDNALQVLNTYYPERVSFSDYQTTEAGVFYLPEKIWPGRYYLRELTEPAGYDKAEHTAFYIDKMYDWPDPFVVRVPVYPSRNIIRIQMYDAGTGQGVSGGSFAVVAAEDILTTDGSLRFREGETADTIVCDEEGYGESIELYLGNYIVREKDIPQYYAGQTAIIESQVQKKTSVEAPVHILQSERTTISFRLTDELYPEKGIEGAEFEVYSDAFPAGRVFKTDSRGYITLDEVLKDTTYYLQEVTAPGDYILSENAVQVPVSANGRMEDGSAVVRASGSNRMIRMNIGVSEVYTNAQIPDISMTLYEGESMTPVSTWTSTGGAKLFTNLVPGTQYYISVGENTQRKYGFSVENTAAMQQFNVRRVTGRSILYIAATLAGSIAVLAVLFVIMKSRLKRSGKKR